MREKIEKALWVVVFIGAAMFILCGILALTGGRGLGLWAPLNAPLPVWVEWGGGVGFGMMIISAPILLVLRKPEDSGAK